MPRLTKYLTFDHSGLSHEDALKILNGLKERISKDGYENLNVISYENNILNIEGKIEINSINFLLKAEVMLHDSSFRVKYETDSPLNLSGKIISQIRTYLQDSLKDQA